MQHPTEHYSKLKENVAQAAKLVRGVNPAECKTDLQHLKLHAYVLMAHAIIEQYLEDTVLSVALTALRTYKTDQKITRALIALAVSGLVDEIGSGKKKSQIGGDLVRSLSVFADAAMVKFRTLVRSNNGVKERNLDGLFIPIGVVPNDVDLALVQSLESLGRERGGIAHSFAIKRELTLSAFSTDLNAIVRDLALLDDAACATLTSNLG